MKYRVTEKHPVYKSGLKIEQKHENCFHLLGSDDTLYLNTVEFIINGWLDEGWIEEIQEPEFTRDEVIHILNKYNTDFVSACGKCDFVELIKEWEYQKKIHNEDKNKQ